MSVLNMLLIGVLMHFVSGDKEFIAKLTTAKAVIQESMDEILQEWNVSLYPNFLKSASSSRHSFDYMKHKVRKIGTRTSRQLLALPEYELVFFLLKLFLVSNLLLFLLSSLDTTKSTSTWTASCRPPKLEESGWRVLLVPVSQQVTIRYLQHQPVSRLAY